MTIIIICIVLLPVLAVLAMISRKHFSKYKGDLWFLPRVAERLQKVEVLYGRSLEDATEQYIEQWFRRFLIWLAVMWFAAWGIFLLPTADPAAGEITRPKAGEPSSEVRVQLTDGAEEQTISLYVEPVQVSSADFNEIVDDLSDRIWQAVLGENEDLQGVTKNLNFPGKDASGRITISWDTDRLTVISRNGTVRREELEAAEEVTIRATFSDGVHTAETEKTVTVLPLSATETTLEKAARTLLQLEESQRDDEVLRLPETVDDVVVSRKTNDSLNMICKLYPGLILISGIMVIHRTGKEKEKLKKREMQLQRVFYRFVSRLSLMISAGENLQSALLAAAAVDEHFLLPEVQYALNRIRTGIPEAAAYGDLGRSLGGKAYNRLFVMISTAGPRGSSQLLNLLWQEVQTAENEARDYARKRGEQAQEKLLVPMIILMTTVIGIVLYPAVAGM